MSVFSSKDAVVVKEAGEHLSNAVINRPEERGVQSCPWSHLWAVFSRQQILQAPVEYQNTICVGFMSGGVVGEGG